MPTVLNEEIGVIGKEAVGELLGSAEVGGVDADPAKSARFKVTAREGFI